nr:type II toxin-antitoxin system VapC family toxin [Halomonas olivaria]
MLDTCICSFIMREQPNSVIHRLATEVERGNRIVVSAITYAEMRYGQIGKKASARHAPLVDAFVKRLDAVLPWDKQAVDATIELKQFLAKAGTPIGPNDSAIAGHALASTCILVSNNIREFSRVPGLVYEDWVH